MTDGSPRPREEQDPDEPRPAGPVYPTGPALRVPREAVQLTFLEPGRVPEREDGEEDPAPGFEIKSPIGVKLPVFEGPMDLLLYLIRRDELDIYDIPIGHITEQYLAVLDAMQVMDLDVAGEFLVTAATLMRLKARMLLPTWPEGEEEEEDPRADLVRQLLEYRRFKEAARRLREQEEARRRWFARGFLPAVESEGPVELLPVSSFALIDVMKDVLSRVGEEFFYEVAAEEVTVEEKIALILEELRENGRVLFRDLLLRTPRRMHAVVTFMAVLELANREALAVAQEGTFGEIWLYRVEAREADETEAASALSDAGGESAGPSEEMRRDDSAGEEKEKDTHGTA